MMGSKTGRNPLWDLIEAGEARNAARQIGEYARDAGEKASTFVRTHPLASVAGVAVIGITIGAMTRPGRRLGRRIGVLATYAVELGIAHAAGLLDQAGDAMQAGKQAGRDRIEDLGDSIGDAARAAKREAVYRGGKGADAARVLVRGAIRQADRSTRDLRARLKG